MTPEQAGHLCNFLVECLEQEAKTTRRVLEAVPAAGNSYRPDPKSRTGLELAWHIAASDAWFVNGILSSEFKMEGDNSTSVPPEIKTAADIVSYYDQNYVPRIEQLKSLSGEKLATVVNFLGVFDLPLVVYLQWLNDHEIHHRGQLCAYLRAMGSRVPNIYGGSADEPMQMGASA